MLVRSLRARRFHGALEPGERRPLAGLEHDALAEAFEPALAVRAEAETARVLARLRGAARAHRESGPRGGLRARVGLDRRAADGEQRQHDLLSGPEREQLLAEGDLRIGLRAVDDDELLVLLALDDVRPAAA